MQIRALAALPRHHRVLWDAVPEAPDGGPYEPLAERLQRFTPEAKRPGLGLAAALRIGRDVAEALTFLHFHGICAGTLDVSRVLVGPAGQALLRPALEGVQTGDPMDSIGYRDLKREDLRQLGVMIFELVARRRFTRRDRDHLEQGFPILALARSGVPEAADDLVCELILANPRRPCRRVKDALDRLRHVVDELERPPDPRVAAAPAPTAAAAHEAPAGSFAPGIAGITPDRLLKAVSVFLAALLVLLELGAAWRSAGQ